MNHRRDAEAGYSLVELLVVISILAVIGSITLGIMLSAFRTQRSTVEHVDALNSAKIALERTTRDIRSANPLTAASPTGIEVEQVEGATTRTRSWLVAPVAGSTNLYRCTTTLATCSSSSGQLVAQGLGADPVFRYLDATGAEVAPGATLTTTQRESVETVVVRVVIPRSNGQAVDLSNNIQLRNSGS